MPKCSLTGRASLTDPRWLTQFKWTAAIWGMDLPGIQHLFGALEATQQMAWVHVSPVLHDPADTNRIWPHQPGS